MSGPSVALLFFSYLHFYPFLMKSQKLIVGIFLLIVAGLCYFLFTSYQNAREAKIASRWINHTYDVIVVMDDLEVSVFELESRVRGYVLSGNDKFLSNHKGKLQLIYASLENLNRLVKDNPPQLKRFTNVEQQVQRKVSFQQQVLATYPREPQQALALIASGQGKILADSIKSNLKEMRDVERSLLVLRTQKNENITDRKLILNIIAVTVIFVLFVAGLLQLGQENRLRRNAENEARDQEAKYKGLVENAGVVVTTVNLKGNFDFVSSKCMLLTGYTAEELSGNYFTFLVPDAWKKRVAQFYFDQLNNSKAETFFSFPITTKDGEERWVEQNAVLLRQGKEILGFQCIIKDITEKNRTDALLAEAENKIKAEQEEFQFRMQAILDNIPMIVYLKDLEGRFLMVNKYFKEAFNTTDEKILGKTAYEISSPDIAGNHQQADEQVRETLETVEREDVVITKEGKKSMLVTKFPLFDKQQKLFAICGVDKDISEMVRNREELVAARLRAEEAERLQEEFLANMSHEIRTPMNGIIGMTHLLSDSALSAQQQEWLQIIKYSSDSLLILINDILDLSKVKAGRMLLDEHDFHIHEVIEQVMLPMQVPAQAKGITLTKNIDNELPAFVWGDQHKLIQILNNLLSNAMKFTEKGGVTLDVAVKEKTDYTVLLKFLVSDTGIGIPHNKIDSVFDSFVQAETDTVSRFGGTGLGLAITKRLVELHGGRISVESKQGRGSVFSFEISYARSERKQAEIASQIPSNEKEPANFDGQKILVVEDNEVNQKVIKAILEKYNLSITLTNNGKEAINLLEVQPGFDLIIMDLQMPEMNGFQATTYIRNKLRIKAPIIAMTASAMRDEKRKCLEMGMNQYLTKPFSPSEIVKHIRYYLCHEKQAEADVTAPVKSSEIYNLALLYEMDDSDYVKEVLTLFLETTPELLKAVKTGALYEDWDTVYQKAHKLKTSLGLLQANKMLEQITRIEEHARLKNNLAEVPGLISGVLEQFDLLVPMLQAEIKEVS